MAGKSRGGFGPGFIVTAAFIGPGTVTTCTLAGAKFGFNLIWAILFAAVTAFILQEMTGRLGLATGGGLAKALREYPENSTVSWVFVLITLSAITFGCAAYEAGNIIGGSMGLELITGIDRRVWGIVISLFALFILNFKRYKIVEKFLIFLVCVMSLAFLGTLIMIAPDIGKIASGFIPSFPPGSVFLIIGLIGTTVVPYNLFLHSSVVKEKWNSARDLPFLRKDLALAIALGGVISTSIIITSASTLFNSVDEVSNAADLAVQLEPLFGRFTEVMFGVGFFAAGMSSALTAPYAAAFATSGTLGWKDGEKSPKFRAVWTAVILIGMFVSLFNLKAVAVIVFAQMANGLILPVASVFLLIVLNNRKKMGKLTNTRLQNLFGTVVILIVSGLGIWSIAKIFF